MSSSRGPLDPEDALGRFDDLYRAHYRQIVAYAMRRTPSVEAADDVVAATFLVAWSRLEHFVGAKEPLAWLYAVARRTVLTHRRSDSKTTRIAEKAAAEHRHPAEMIESTFEARERLSDVTAAMHRLSETDRELLRLVGWEQCDHAELASILDISRTDVRTRLLRSRPPRQAAYEAHRDTPPRGGR